MAILNYKNSLIKIIISKILILSLILTQLSGCYTYRTGDYIRTEKAPDYSRPTSYQLSLSVREYPTIDNPKIVLKTESIPIYSVFSVNKYQEIREKSGFAKYGGKTLWILGLTGLVVAAAAKAGTEQSGLKSSTGTDNSIAIVGGIGLLLTITGAIIDYGISEKPIITKNLMDGEKYSSGTTEGNNSPISNQSITVKIGNKTIDRKTDKDGLLSLDLINDFDLSFFSTPRYVGIEVLADDNKDQVQINSTYWTVPFIQITNSNYDIIEGTSPNSRTISRTLVGEEYRILEESYDFYKIEFGKSGGWVSKTSGGKFWSVQNRYNPQQPANLLIESVNFIDSDKNNYLDANEKGLFIINIKNNGKGNAYRTKCIITQLSQNNGTIELEKNISVGTIKPNEEKEIKIDLKAPKNILSEQYKYKIEITEANGFDADPVEVSFITRAYRSPNIEVAEIGIEDPNDTRQIKLGESVDITVRLKNNGMGEAKDVNAMVDLRNEGQNVFYHGAKDFSIGNLKSGEFYDIKFSIMTNKRYRENKIPVSINITENYADNNKNIPLDLPLNIPIKSIKEIIIAGKEEEKTNIIQPSLVADVDQNIPKTNIKNPNAVAVIIGISKYQNKDIPSVDYARSDASSIKQYLIDMFGYDEKRIIEIYDIEASLSAFKRIFEEQLPNYVTDNSDVFIYYSGHGVPDVESKEAYFVPYDCNPSYAKSTGYKLSEFYQRLSNLYAKSVTVVLDACFSGSSDNGMLLKGVSPISINVKNPIANIPNGTIFTSSSNEQVSVWYPEKKHGLFTYYFLKGLKGEADTNGDKEISVEEMENYLLKNIPIQARFLRNREQTPQVLGNHNNVLIRY